MLLPMTRAESPEITVAFANASLAGANDGVKLRFKLTEPIAPFLPSTAIQYSVPAAAVKVTALVVAAPLSSLDATAVSDPILVPV